MSDRGLITLLTLVVCSLLSFLFSGVESGVMALNRVRIRQLMRAGDRRAAVLHGFLQSPENFLWTILVGNTIVNFIIILLGALELHIVLWGSRALWCVAFGASVFIFYILCELLPKTLFRRYPNRLTLLVAQPFQWMHRFLGPVVAVAEWLAHALLRLTGGRPYTARLFNSRDELRFVMQDAAKDLTSEERAMINRVLDLQSVRVERVAIPMANVATIDAGAPVADVLARCRELNFTRLPVTDKGRVVGIVTLEYVLYLPQLDSTRPTREFMQPALFLMADAHLEEALRRMQRAGARLAVALSQDHRELGVVSLQDIFKVIFGRVTL